MSDNKEILVKKARETAGEILHSAISASVTSLDAVKLFPKGIDDLSLKIAWHALIHFAADEEIRINDAEYAQEQMKYIDFIAKLLSEGKSLPKNILDEYEEYYIDTVLPQQDNFIGRLKRLFRFLE